MKDSTINYERPATESWEFYAEQLKSITKEYPKDHPQFGATQGGYHFVNGDSLAIESEFGEMLMNDIATLKPNEIVEIGMGHGYSTSWLLLGILRAGKGNLTSFDNCLRDWHFKNIPGKVKVHFMDFKDVTNELPEKIDFVFHDGSHYTEHVIRDLDILFPHVSDHCKFWFHDAYEHVSVPLKKYFDEKGWDYLWIKESSNFGCATRRKG